MRYSPFKYQEHLTQHIIDNPAAGIFAGLGMGKSVTTLTAIDKLINDYCEVNKVLVIAPKMVAENTWSAECAKWSHLKHLRISKVLGTERQRKAALALTADIYVTNRENVQWLVAYLQDMWPFDMCVIDELSSFKSAKSGRFKALKMVRPKISRVVGLTGTPSPNSLQDLWSQVYLLDRGERLGKTISNFRDLYFKPDKRNGHIVYSYKIASPDVPERLTARIQDICISMKAKDYLDLPGSLIRPVEVVLSPAEMGKYKEFEREQVLAMLSGEEITAVNAAVLSGKLLQFAGGGLYGEDKSQHHVVHERKIERLKELIDTATGPVLIGYMFKHEAERIRAVFPEARPIKTAADIADWNAGRIEIALLHPQSGGHGLNLQPGAMRSSGTAPPGAWSYFSSSMAGWTGKDRLSLF
jgi:SNF2 family DNA or RNA helicase